MNVRGALVVCLGLVTGWTASAQKSITGESFAGPLVSAKAPSTGVWFLHRRSDTAITFGSGEVGNTFVAEVALFRIAATATPKEFEALVKKKIASDGRDPNHPNRYELLEQSVKYLGRARMRRG